MIFKKTVSITGSNANATTFITDHLTGELRMLRLVKGTMTTKKTLTFGVQRAGTDDSTSCAFLVAANKTSDMNYRPMMAAHSSVAGATNFRVPVVLANDKIKVWVQDTTDASAVTATAIFYIDGIPGLGGTTTT